MTAREQAEMHIFGQTVGKEIGDALIDGDVRRLTKTIQSAILAEREACAKICDSVKDETESLVAPEMVHLVSPITDPLKYCAKKIRARSNAPETPNKPLESPVSESPAIRWRRD